MNDFQDAAFDNDIKHDRPHVGDDSYPLIISNVTSRKRARPLSNLHPSFSKRVIQATHLFSGTHCEAERKASSTSMDQSDSFQAITTIAAPAAKKRPRSASLHSEAPPRRSTRIAAALSTTNGTHSQSSFIQVSAVYCGMTGNSGRDSVNNSHNNNSGNLAAAVDVTTSTGYAEISPSPSRTSTPDFLSSSSDLDTQSLHVSTASCGMTLINSQGDSVNNLSQTNSAAASDVTTSTGHAEIFQQSLKLMDDSNA